MASISTTFLQASLCLPVLLGVHFPHHWQLVGKCKLLWMATRVSMVRELCLPKANETDLSTGKSGHLRMIQTNASFLPLTFGFRLFNAKQHFLPLPSATLAWEGDVEGNVFHIFGGHYILE